MKKKSSFLAPAEKAENTGKSEKKTFADAFPRQAINALKRKPGARPLMERRMSESSAVIYEETADDLQGWNIDRNDDRSGFNLLSASLETANRKFSMVDCKISINWSTIKPFSVHLYAPVG